MLFLERAIDFELVLQVLELLVLQVLNSLLVLVSVVLVFLIDIAIDIARARATL